MALTDKGQEVVGKVKAHYAMLLPQYGRDTFERTVFDLGKITASVICYAIGNPSGDDIADMIRQGYGNHD